MNVRLDESRKDVTAVRVDGAVVWASMMCGAMAAMRPSLDRHVALDDLEPIVHRDDDAAANQ